MQHVSILSSRSPEDAVAVEADHWTLLITEIAQGNRHALAELYAAIQRPLFLYLCQMTPDRGLAEEILQDTLIAVWKGASSFEGRSSVRTWIFGIARRQTHNALRGRGLAAIEDEEALERVPAPGPSLEERALAEVETEELAKALNQLSAIHKEVIILALIQGLPQKDIAEIVGVPEGTIKSRLNNARRSLRQMLESRERGAHPANGGGV
jgi:RNA polymerase sigma-70 factor (ECF subfamily)